MMFKNLMFPYLLVLSGCFVFIDKNSEAPNNGYTQFEENATDSGSTTTDSGTFDTAEDDTAAVDTAEPVEPEPTAEPEDTSIEPDDFHTCEEEQFNGSLYLFCPNSFGLQGWLLSEMYCNEWNGHLVSINDFNEFEWLTIKGTLLDANGRWWIGLNDRNTEETWEWVNGDPFDYSPGWHESNDAIPEDDCVYMGRDGDGWRRVNCLSEQTFICEK